MLAAIRSEQANPSRGQFDDPTRNTSLGESAHELFEPEVDEHQEPTRLANMDGSPLSSPRNPPPSNDERTRAVHIRSDKSISDIDWDLD